MSIVETCPSLTPDPRSRDASSRIDQEHVNAAGAHLRFSDMLGQPEVGCGNRPRPNTQLAEAQRALGGHG